MSELVSSEQQKYDACRMSFAVNLEMAFEQYRQSHYVGWWKRWKMSRVLNSQRALELVERECCKILVESGKMTYASAGGLVSDENGLLVETWEDFFAMLIEALPKILDFIAGIAAIFML